MRGWRDVPKHRTCGHNPKNATVGITEAAHLGKADVVSEDAAKHMCARAAKPAHKPKECLRRVHSL